MKRAALKQILQPAAMALALGVAAIQPAEACTRVVYLGSDGLVVTGRSMDWAEDMHSNLWAFPKGMTRDGAAGPNTPKWTSKYGSLIVAGYDVGSADGMNEMGLVANLLYLAESDYGTPPAGAPLLSISLWAQYVLDNFATVNEAVEALQSEPFKIVAPDLPNGKPSSLHLSISDAERRFRHLRVSRRQARHPSRQAISGDDELAAICRPARPQCLLAEHRRPDLPARHQPGFRPLRPRLVSRQRHSDGG